ncbi:MAG: TonB-dependent receptor [Terracidiphilus sp.]
MRAFRICSILAVLLATAGLAFGQAGATGTILGTVTDSTGAIIPNVKITVTNTATNVAFHTVTSSAGDYYAPSLNPGTYSVSAESKGFQKSVTTGFKLDVDQKIRVDLALRPGAVTETLEVTAQAVTLDTDSAALSQLVSQQQVEELPLNGRNFMQLLLVGAGAVTVGGEQGTMRQGEGDAISVNGGRPEGNNYTLDGLVNTDPALVTPAVILSQDAIGEFKVESGTYPAEYGFSASQINIVSKGGSNRLHGAFFEDNRNDAYDAVPFATIEQFLPGATATSNPILRQNQFGFVLSGPVYIPKVYDGRNKSFFMANYEGWRINNGGIAYETVPNPAVLQGNFDAETYPTGIKSTDGTITLPGGKLPLYGTSDCGILLDNGYNCMPVDPTTGQAFPNNQLPSTAFTARIGQVAVKHGYWATPTTPNQPEGVTNMVKGYPGTLRTNQQTYRGDQNLGKLGSVFGRYTKSTYVNHSLYNSGSLNYGIEEYFENQKAWALSHTINLGRSNVNNFRFGYLDAYAPESSVTPPSTLAAELSETGVFTHFGPLQETYPNVGLSTYSSGGGPVNSYSGSDSPAWEWADSFTTVRGRHTFGLGLDYRTYSLTRNLDDDFYGDWGFSSTTARKNSAAGSCPNAPVSVNGGAPAPLCGSGNAVADMMLGYYGNVGGFVPGPLSPTNEAGNPQKHIFKYFAPYAEDDWKVTPKLTVSLGLRWDFRAATTEAQNHFFWLDTKNANGGLCYADPKLSSNGVAPGGDANSGPILRYCGSVPHPGSKTPFAPRFGLNYRLNDKMVVRGGYGIFYDSYEGREIDDSADIYPYSIRNSLVPSSVTTLPKFSNQLFPSYNTLGAFPASTLSFIAVIESENPLNPYVQSWTASVEREVAKNTTLEVNYIGTHSIHLLNRHDIAQPYALSANDQPFCQHKDASGNYDNLSKAPCSAYTAMPDGSFPRLPYKNFQGFYIDSDFHGYSHYNAMNVKFEHRAKDTAVTAVYTWANSKDDKSAAAGVGASGTGYQGFMDNHNTKLDYGPSDFDVDQRFVSSFIYNVPIGHGKKIAPGAGRLEDLAIGGWELTGITTFQTGFPFGVTSNDIGGVQGTVAPRPNLVSGCNYHGNLTGKFQRLNMSCFSQQLPGTFGNTTRNFLRQPGINNWDMGFAKNFHFTETLNFKLTVDTFNTFNHHQYSGDVGGLVVGGSGGNEVIDNSVNSSSATAGRITGASSPRIIQLGGKLTF